MGHRPDDPGKLAQARKKARKLGLGEGYTLILCLDRKTEKCCSCDLMVDAWKHLKRRSNRWRKENGHRILRIRSGCIGVCKSGPIIGVMPDDVWYGRCTPDVIDRIFDEHLTNGEIVQSHLISLEHPDVTA